MKQYNCLIVDDEPIARDIILNYCSHLPYLRVLGSCGSAFEAKNILREQHIDILFLDIHMPVLDGIRFISTLKNPPQIIFTTAYKEYAATAFDLSACDYLVKPFPLERFITAVEKAIEKLSSSDMEVKQEEEFVDKFLFLKAGGKIYKINYDDLLFAEAKGNLTKIVTTAITISSYISFTDFQNMLPDSIFSRIHRSFIINKSKITHIDGNRLFINKIEIPIGNSYRQSFFKSMGII